MLLIWYSLNKMDATITTVILYWSNINLILVNVILLWEQATSHDNVSFEAWSPNCFQHLPLILSTHKTCPVVSCYVCSLLTFVYVHGRVIPWTNEKACHSMELTCCGTVFVKFYKFLSEYYWQYRRALGTLLWKPVLSNVFNDCLKAEWRHMWCKLPHSRQYSSPITSIKSRWNIPNRAKPIT